MYELLSAFQIEELTEAYLTKEKEERPIAWGNSCGSIISIKAQLFISLCVDLRDEYPIALSVFFFFFKYELSRSGYK